MTEAILSSHSIKGGKALVLDYDFIEMDDYF